jgi:hypothetical protein
MSTPAEHHDLHGESLCLVDVTGHDAIALWQQARAALTDHYPALLLTYKQLDHLATPPAELLARRPRPTSTPTSPNAPHCGHPTTTAQATRGTTSTHTTLATSARSRRWRSCPDPSCGQAFAYLNSFGSMYGDSSALLIAAVRRWHERYRAVPTVIAPLPAARATLASSP